MNLALFDFDGTLTRRDSLFHFLIVQKGWLRFLVGMFILTPKFIGWKLGRIDTQTAKEHLFQHFWRGINYSTFLVQGEKYLSKLERITRENALIQLQKHQSRGDQVVVVTASCSPWVLPWCKKNGVDLICTQLVTEKGLITGKIAGKNCQGREKVNRIKEKYNLSEYNEIYAYGNSKGDTEMLELADKNYYRCF